MNEFDKEEHTEDIWYSQIYVDCSMCNLYLSQQREWCKYCINGCYCKLVKKHKG